MAAPINRKPRIPEIIIPSQIGGSGGSFILITNFHSFLFKPDKDRFLNRHAMVNGCEVKPGDHICHALNDMVDEDIGGSLKPLESIKGHLNYFLFVLVHFIFG